MFVSLALKTCFPPLTLCKASAYEPISSIFLKYATVPGPWHLYSGLAFLGVAHAGKHPAQSWCYLVFGTILIDAFQTIPSKSYKTMKLQIFPTKV